jgi:hypothetical protein
MQKPRDHDDSDEHRQQAKQSPQQEAKHRA